MPELFGLTGVQVERDGRHVLGPIDLEIPDEGPVVIAGPSGSGKSSLLRLLNRLDAPSAGTVTLRGQDVGSLDPQSHRRRVAMVFQRPVVLPGTVADNLREACATIEVEAMHDSLARVGLPASLLDRPANALSGGEAQRMCIARSLLTDPEVVLFDEPTSALDPANSRRIEDVARSLQAQSISTIWVTHDLDQLRRLAEHVVFIDGGALAQAGPAPSVLAAPVPAVAGFLQGGQE